MQVTFLLLAFFFIQNTVLPCRQSFDVLQRAKSVSAQWFPQRDWAHWFVVRSLTAHSGLQCGVRLCAIVCTEDFDSTQLFTVRSPTQPSGLQCRVRTLHSGFRWRVRLCAIVCTLQCGVRICAVVCSAESDSTQWFAVWSPTLRSGFFCRVESDFVQYVDYNVETQRSGLQCGVQLLALLSRGPNDTFYYL